MYSKIPYMQSSSCECTFKDEDGLLHVQSHKSVRVSGVRCPVRAFSTCGCAFVYFTEHHCVGYSTTVSLFQAQDVQKQA